MTQTTTAPAKAPFVHCPYCDSERGVNIPWGMSPSGWAEMQQRHNAGHLVPNPEKLPSQEMEKILSSWETIIEFNSNDPMIKEMAGTQRKILSYVRSLESENEKARVRIEELEGEVVRLREENGRMKTFLETEAIQIIFSEGTSGSEFAVAYSQKSLNALMVSLTPDISI